jgi:tRNA modification GTPase
MASTDDTIVAIATPPGRGGIGVVRLSGDRAISIATDAVRFAKTPLETQRATLGELVDPETGRALDQVVTTCFRKPHSYTAEDVVEISCHGSPVILKFLVEQCLERGARMAEPGEFTERAFLSGRIDLTQAEAIRDLIESRTLYQARVAAQQMQGSVSARVKPYKQVLMEFIARLEAGIDFAEDDVAVMGGEEIASRLGTIRADLEKLAENYQYGRIVREGLSLAIIGRPNVGKSSLFNRILKAERAIVTATPGTTRDLVAESASVGGIPLRLVDTAGIREAADEAERMGVEKSWQAIADSDLRLLVIDASAAWSHEEAGLLEKIRPLGALAVALNKSDLAARISRQEVDGKVAAGKAEAAVKVISTSALSGEGIEKLREAILELATPAGGHAEGEMVTNLRHQQLLKESLAAIVKAQGAAAADTHHEMLLLDLYDALRPLDALTGATDVEDLLGIIFSTFCVGK